MRPQVTRRGALVAAFALILVAGAALRLIGTNWDDGAHLHPDERYISTVADNIRWPSGLLEYLDVERSPLSPYNTEQGVDYLYGTLPLFSTKLVATVLGQDGYGELNLVGRRVAALLDTLTLVLVFLIARLLLVAQGSRRALVGGLLAAALYAFTVTAIQHAHFFTTDVWVVFFATLTLFLALRSLRAGVDADSRSPSPAVHLVGAALGLTVACKVSGALVVVPVGLALVARAVLVSRWAGARASVFRLLADTGVVLVSAYVAFRFVSPYTFERSSWLDVSVNDQFREAVEAQARNVAGPSAFPPSYQWQLSSPVWSPLENLALWQLGVPLALAALAGLVVLATRIMRGVREWARLRGRIEDGTVVRTTSQLMLVGYVAMVFLYFAIPFVHSGRYLLPIIPVLAVAAAVALMAVAGRSRGLAIAAAALVVGLTALYGIAFAHIYTQPNTRVAASDWIAENIPPGSWIANEHWDDALPIGGPWGLTRAQALALDGFRGIQVSVFHPDDEKKVRDLYDALAGADYYVLSSPRAWNTIGRLPGQFPLMPRFYDELFAERLGFTRVASFASYPQIAGIEVDDLRAEEAFWVYDHPPVTVFRRDGPLRLDEFEAALCPQPVPPYCA